MYNVCNTRLLWMPTEKIIKVTSVLLVWFLLNCFYLFIYCWLTGWNSPTANKYNYIFQCIKYVYNLLIIIMICDDQQWIKKYKFCLSYIFSVLTWIFRLVSLLPWNHPVPELPIYVDSVTTRGKCVCAVSVDKLRACDNLFLVCRVPHTSSHRWFSWKWRRHRQRAFFVTSHWAINLHSILGFII